MPERLGALALLLCLLAGPALGARYQAVPAGLEVHDLDSSGNAIIAGHRVNPDGSRQAAVGRYNSTLNQFDQPIIDVPADAVDSVVEAIADGGSPRLLAGHYTGADGVARPLVWPWGADIPDPSDPIVLPPLADGYDAQALGVNRDHLVVGWALDVDGQEYPVYWKEGPVDPEDPENSEVAWQITRLSLPQGALGGRATGVSPAGRVAGYALTASGETVALVWDAGALDAPPRLLLDPDGQPAQASRLSGQYVAGWTGEAGAERPLRWRTLATGGETVTTLPGLGNGSGRALGVNARGETVGEALDETGARRAFLHTDLCGTFDLNRLLSVDAPFSDGGQWTLVSAHAINEPNPAWIAVDGEDAAGAGQGFILVPTNTSPVDLKMTVRADRDSVHVGEPLSYTIEVTNVGAHYATCVVVEDRLYTGVSLVSVSADRGRCEGGVDQARCVVDELPSGERLRMTVTTTPRPVLVDRVITNVVTVSSGEQDLSPEDERIETQTPVPRQGCFIATAAYGSYLAPEVGRLRAFRDRWLLPHAPGRALVDLYYRLSPPAAAWLQEHPAARPWVRAALAPLVWGVSRPGWVLGALGLALAAALLRRRQGR